MRLSPISLGLVLALAASMFLRSALFLTLVFSSAQANAGSRSCDLGASDKYSESKRAKIDRSPASASQSCREIADYARARQAETRSRVPQRCSAFASLDRERSEAALYQWAYGSAVAELKRVGKADRAAKIQKALTAYSAQFKEYATKVEEGRALCVRVHSPSAKASAGDATKWANSGRVWSKSSIEARRSAIWNRHGVKSTLDRSFGSIKKMFR